VLASNVNALSTDSRGPESLPDHFCEEAFLPEASCSRARMSSSRWLVILVGLKSEMLARIFFMSSSIL